jgi:aspartyl-tRNA(Asn)/glutamyl-tRNA(Gln) amidotransferase subunit B
MIDGDLRDVDAIVEEKGWKQMENHDELEHLCDNAMAEYQDKVKAIQKGNIGVLGFFVGHIMKQSRGRANPVIVNQILRAKMGLAEGSPSADAATTSDKKAKKKKKE